MNSKKDFTNWYDKRPKRITVIIKRCIVDKKNANAYSGEYNDMIELFNELKSPSNDILLSQFKKNYKEEFDCGNKTAIFDKLIDNPIFFYKFPLPGTNDFVVCPVFDMSTMTAPIFMKMKSAAYTNDIQRLHELSPYKGRKIAGVTPETASASTSAETYAETYADTESLLQEDENTIDNEIVSSNNSNSPNNIVRVRDKVTVKEKKKTIKKKMDCSDSSLAEFNLQECVNGLSLEQPKVQNAIKQADKNQAKIIRDNWETTKTVFYEICVGRQNDKLHSEDDVLKYLFNFINRKSTREDFVEKICERAKDDKPKPLDLDPYRFEQIDEYGNRSYNGIRIPANMPPRPSAKAILKSGRWRA